MSEQPKRKAVLHRNLDGTWLVATGLEDGTPVPHFGGEPSATFPTQEAAQAAASAFLAADQEGWGCTDAALDSLLDALSRAPVAR
jgi:hypothetical protein